jgi:hypothetical protein
MTMTHVVFGFSCDVARQTRIDAIITRICWNFFGCRFKALSRRKARPFDRWFPSVSGNGAEFCMKHRCTELGSYDPSNIGLNEKEGRTDAQ